MRLTLLLSVVIAVAAISKGGEVVLTSDPPGSTIFAGGKQLGTTPLTADLPPGPIEVTSRFGTLAPVVQALTPDDAQVVAFHFKHSYGTLIVSSDRADAALTIDGTNFGHPPALVFLTPGTHKVFITATNAPDKTRNVDVAEGQRASVEIHFTGASPETVTGGPSPTVSASPAKASSSLTAPPVKASPKPKPSPQLMVWQEPPSALPLASASPSPKVSAPPSPQPKDSQTRNTSRLARAQPSPSATPDPAKAKALLETEWKAKESALAAEKQRIQYEIANSTGATREQWKYKLALWRLKKEQAEASAKAEPSKAYAFAASPSATPDPAKMKAEYALLQTEWKAKENALAAEKQRIEYEIKNSTGATREQWKYKLALWRREEAQAEQDQAAAKARLSTSRGRSGTP